MGGIGARYTDKDEPANHQSWQGKIYSISDDLLNKMGYEDKDYDNEENKQKYDLYQKQRAMEQKIRETKKQLYEIRHSIKVMHDENQIAAMKEELSEVKALFDKQFREYEVFCKQNGLKLDQERLYVGNQKNAVEKSLDSAIIESRNSMKSGKYPTSDSIIKDISEKELSGVKFSHSISYNGRIRSQGKTTAEISPLGNVKIKSIEIGKQVVDSRECVIDTMLHEELEARIMLRAKNNKFYSRLNEASDKVRHEYINKIIKRFFAGKGWNYEATK